jgi:hypothetical protein
MRVLRVLFTCSSIVVCMTACTRPATRPAPAEDPVLAQASTYERSVQADLERVRAATYPYRDIRVAHSAGFPTAIPACLDNPPAGGMGQHYVDRRILDDQLDVERPEILVYAPTKDGQQRLVGVEYIVPLAKWDRPQAPRIFGQSLKRSEQLQLWYLHVWAWEKNEAGLFADWNAAVKC